MRCAICGEDIRPDEERVETPDFLADDRDPYWLYSSAGMHQSCFLYWDQRKRFIARFNQVARRLVGADGRFQHMTAEGRIELRRGGTPPPIVA